MSADCVCSVHPVGHVVDGLDIIRAMRGGERIDRIELVRPGTTELPLDFDVLTPDGETIRLSEVSKRTPTPSED